MRISDWSSDVCSSDLGLATLSEMLSGAMDIGRMKRISLRIVAIDKAIHGADFIEVFRFFIESGQSDIDSFTSAQRVFRGVPLSGGGAFTKDTVYLHRSEEHTSELQSLMRTSYSVFCLKKQNKLTNTHYPTNSSYSKKHEPYN